MSIRRELFLLDDEDLSLFSDFFISFSFSYSNNVSIRTRSGSDILAQLHTFETNNQRRDSFSRFYIAKLPRRNQIQNIQSDLWILSGLRLEYDECGILLFQQKISPNIARMIMVDLSDRWIPVYYHNLRINNYLTANRDDFFSILHANRKIASGIFLQNHFLEDDFYTKLIEEINICYHRKSFTSVSILTRKLIENLLIDILRAKYGLQTPDNLAKYFNTAQNRHKNFSILLSNFWRNFNTEFRNLCNIGSSSELQSIQRKMEELKSSHNSATHSIEIIRSRSDIDEEKSKIQLIFNFLCRILQNLM